MCVGERERGRIDVWSDADVLIPSDSTPIVVIFFPPLKSVVVVVVIPIGNYYYTATTRQCKWIRILSGSISSSNSSVTPKPLLSACVSHKVYIYVI